MAYAGYIRELFWPAGLAVFYPLPRNFSYSASAATAAGLLAITFAAALRLKRQPWFTVGWSWFLITLVPVIGWIQVGSQSMADRYTYVPYVGLFVLLVWGGGEALARHTPTVQRLGTGVAVAVLVALAWLSARQLEHWKNSITLFNHAVAVTANNDRAQNNLAAALFAAGRLGEAGTHARAAIGINPKSPTAQSNLGTVYFKMDRLEDAVRQYRIAWSLAPANPDFAFKLGSALHKLGRVDEAAPLYCRTLLLAPDHPMAHFCLGEILSARGRPEAALVNLRWAVEMQPDLAPAWESSRGSWPGRGTRLALRSPGAGWLS